MQEEKNQIEPLNLIRTIATLSVFCLHASLYSGGAYGFAFSNKTWFLMTPAWAAVWMFFIVSGYAIGNCFYKSKYDAYSIKGILSFYWRRIKKVLLPVWVFVFGCCIVIEPSFIKMNPRFLLELLTCTYDARPQFNAIGAVWYVSTLMWLYIFSPFVFIILNFIINKVKSHRNIVVVCIACLLICLGFIARNSLYGKPGVDWSSDIYVPFYMNLDIYVCGMLANFIEYKNGCKKIFKISSVILFFSLLIVNMRIYYNAEYWIYCVLFPSIYILVLMYYIICFKYDRRTKLSKIEIKKNPLRMIDLFSGISFGFYLFHNLILDKIAFLITGLSPEIRHIKLLIFAFIITIPFSCFFTNYVKMINKNNY